MMPADESVLVLRSLTLAAIAERHRGPCLGLL